ncbi:MAG: dual specificity protein phosphatase family protein [Pseudomonadota bacterium]
MLPELYKIEEASGGGVISIMRRPSSEWLSDDIEKLSAQCVSHIVCLLTGSEVVELGLQGEEEICRSRQICFRSFPIEDRGVPENATAFISLIHELGLIFESGGHIAIHCRAGIGRSGLSAAAILVAQGMKCDEAFDRISERRRVSVPDTEDQRRWIDMHLAALQS